MLPEDSMFTGVSHNTRDVKYPYTINCVGYSDSDIARFSLKVEMRGDHECWFWRSQTQPNGYGMFRMGARGTAPRYAHRVAYEMVYGPIPRGQHVLHRCDQRNCVNARHLFLGSHTDNMRDASSKRRLNVPHPSSHKVSDAGCAEIVARYAAGEKQYHLAAEFGVTKGWVSRLIRGTARQYRKAS